MTWDPPVAPTSASAFVPPSVTPIPVPPSYFIPSGTPFSSSLCSVFLPASTLLPGQVHAAQSPGDILKYRKVF